MKLFVAYHEREVLQNLPVPDGTTKLYLDELAIPTPFQHNGYAESRALLYLAITPSLIPDDEYVGLFHGSYPTKFSALPPLNELTPPQHPGVFKTPVPVYRFMDQASYCHRGMDSTLAKIFSKCDIKTLQLPGPGCNSFIAHSSVWREFLSDWLRLFIAAIDYIDPPQFDTTNCKPGVEPAYLMERLTIGWFASKVDLSMEHIVSPSGKGYHAVYGPMNEQSVPTINAPGNVARS